MAGTHGYEYFCAILHDTSKSEPSTTKQFSNQLVQRLQANYKMSFPFKTDFDSSAEPRHCVMANILRSTKYLVVLYTDNFLKSPWFNQCETSVHKAVHGALPCKFVPVGLQGFDDFDFCKERQPIVFSDNDDDVSWTKLVADIHYIPKQDVFKTSTSSTCQTGGQNNI